MIVFLQRHLRRELAANPHKPGSFDFFNYQTQCYLRSTDKYLDRTAWVQKWLLIPGIIVYAVAVLFRVLVTP